MNSKLKALGTGVAALCAATLLASCQGYYPKSGVAPKGLSIKQEGIYDNHLTDCVRDLKYSNAVNPMFKKPDNVILETCQCVMDGVMGEIRSIKTWDDYDRLKATINSKVRGKESARRCLRPLADPSRRDEFLPGKYEQFLNTYNYIR